jgi:predicted pyridoxine 5'-phosphate oxidase superfamily flavin-nucleotide-binding protein
MKIMTEKAVRETKVTSKAMQKEEKATCKKTFLFIETIFFVCSRASCMLQLLAN